MEYTVILNVYKRPYLQEQIEAIEKQTIKPKEIIINQNGNYVDIPEGIKNKYTVVQSNKNWGVRFRFIIGLQVSTEFVIFIDDDTIPGKKWVENCYNSFKIQEGLYCAIGHIYPNREQRSPQLARPGRQQLNKDITITDIGGHSWFLKTDWLRYMRYERPPHITYPYCSEDVWLSYSLQKEGIFTLIPPHPVDDIELRGSSKARDYGNDDNANWKGKDREDMIKRQKMYQDGRKNVIDMGFKLLVDYKNG